ncbi:uncharacterized protein LOC117324020 [Pecten maximus]|uniref:uncharacterized protein LOC117324020 n=1 Tax=Pecten maximus TaxID=6579 RepID=UPI00145822F5|nr:uncharacterized protein LOC117324020 [Pecten maximus]
MDNFHFSMAYSFIGQSRREGSATSINTRASLERAHTMSVVRELKRSSKAPPLPRGKDFHVFFCFHLGVPDKDWVKVVSRELEYLGYKCCVFERDFEPGISISANVRNALEKSVRTIVVLSSSYINKEWHQMELEYMAHGAGEISFVPILIEPCGIPPFLKYFQYINATGAKETWWRHLVDTLRGSAPTLPPRKRYHVLIAHNMADTAWVSKIVKTLESPNVGLICCYPGRDFKPGSPVIENVDHAIKRSVKIVLVLSQNFLKLEWKKYYDGRMRGRRPIPVLLNNCELPPSLEDIVCIDTQSEKDLWWPVFLGALTEEDPVNDDAVSSSSKSVVSRQTDKR